MFGLDIRLDDVEGNICSYRKHFHTIKATLDRRDNFIIAKQSRMTHYFGNKGTKGSVLVRQPIHAVVSNLSLKEKE